MTPIYAYPLRFAEILRNYSFGNRWIVDIFQKSGLPENHRIAETWEVCDRSGESSLITNGPLAGTTLSALIHKHPEALLGTYNIQRTGTRFPLLIKLLDASHTLGEQAHHSDELAAEMGLTDTGKTEAWYMLHTRPNASIYCGQTSDAVTKESLHSAILSGEIRHQMRAYPVQPGDSFLLYAGTMHYSPGGVLFYEIMQNSDVYISLGKPSEQLTSREQAAQMEVKLKGIHLENGFECSTTQVSVSNGPNRWTYILACRYFALERLDFEHPEIIFLDGKQFYVLTVIQGSCIVEANETSELLKPGQSCLLPAVTGLVKLLPQPDCALLKAYVPDLLEDIIIPLRNEGISDDLIAALGGRTRLNDLVSLLALT